MTQKNSPLGPLKVKIYTKIIQNQKLELKKTEKIKVDQDAKKIFEPKPDPKNSPLGPQNQKMAPKLIQNQKLELKKT